MNVIHRVDELISEIKKLKDEVKAETEKLASAKCDLNSKDSQISQLIHLNKELTDDLEERKTEKIHLIKKFQNQIKKLEANLKRNDLFLNKTKGTSRTKKERVMMQDMNDLRRFNKILLEFVDVLAQKFGFDPNLLATLSKIAEGTDDILLRLFFEGITKKKKEIGTEDVPLSNMYTSDPGFKD